MLKRKNFTFRSKHILAKRGLRRETYPTAPLGENLLGDGVVCFSEGSLEDRSETLILGMHFEISM